MSNDKEQRKDEVIKDVNKLCDENFWGEIVITFRNGVPLLSRTTKSKIYGELDKN